MKILSLFDGMSCGYLALQSAGVPIDRYVAYEIDKYAITVSSHNFPEIEHCGDVFKADFTQYEGFDFVIGGSPCTYWSIAQTKHRETEAHGIGWELFQQYLRGIKEVKPRFFIYENNKSMADTIKKEISESFGFGPVTINSALVSAQNRQRYYWVGVRQKDGTYRQAHIDQPEDRGILLKDILDTTLLTHSLSQPNVSEDASFGRMVGRRINDEGHRDDYNMDVECVQRFELNDNPLKAYCLKVTGTVHDLDRRYIVPVEEVIPITPVDGSKSHTITASYFKRADTPVSKCKSENARQMIAEHIHVEGMDYELEDANDKDSGVCAHLYMPTYKDANKRVYHTDGKCPTLTTMGGGHRQPKVFSDVENISFGKETPIYTVKDGMITIKDKQYPIKLKDGSYIIRKLTVSECKRLQTIPDSYDMSCISNTQAYKCLGNGWTVEVIAHLIRSVLKDDIPTHRVEIQSTLDAY